MFTKLQLNKIKHGLQKGYISIKYSYITKKGSRAWKKLEDDKKNL